MQYAQRSSVTLLAISSLLVVVHQLYAQSSAASVRLDYTPSAVPNAVKTEVIRNFDLAKTYQIPVPKGLNKFDKHKIEYCNTGVQAKDDTDDRSMDCEKASIWTRNELALYKACIYDLSGGYCAGLATEYIPERHGQGFQVTTLHQGDEFGLAVYEWAPNCRGACLDSALSDFAGVGATGEQLPGSRIDWSNSGMVRFVLQKGDVIHLLSRECLEQGNETMCPFLTQFRYFFRC